MLKPTNKPVVTLAPAKPIAAKPAIKQAPAKRPAKPTPIVAKLKPAAKPKADKAAERLALSSRVTAERATANKAFAALSGAVSVPIKTLAAFSKSYKRDVTAHAIGRKPSARQAAALTIAALAGNKAVTDKATFSRKFTLNGADYAIENGALSDAISAGLCTYSAKSETITIVNAAEIKSKIGTVAKLSI